MNWNQLQYVITIAEEKSITKAAQKLYISQPSLSLSIQALEKETGIPLFERNRGEMTLPYAGSLFYEWAISTLHSHTQLEWKLGDIVSGSRTLIRLVILLMYLFLFECKDRRRARISALLLLTR